MTSSAIDRPTFEELRTTTGEDFVDELVDTFLSEAPEMLADLRKALDDGSAERFRRAAHSLKSNANTFGATVLGKLARELELGGLPLADEDAGAPIQALHREYARVAEALTELKRG